MTEGHKITIYIPNENEEALGQLEHAQRYSKHAGLKKVKGEVTEFTIYTEEDYKFFLTTLSYFLRMFVDVEIRDTTGTITHYHEKKSEEKSAHTSHGHSQFQASQQT